MSQGCSAGTAGDPPRASEGATDGNHGGAGGNAGTNGHDAGNAAAGNAGRAGNGGAGAADSGGFGGAGNGGAGATGMIGGAGGAGGEAGTAAGAGGIGGTGGSGGTSGSGAGGSGGAGGTNGNGGASGIGGAGGAGGVSGAGGAGGVGGSSTSTACAIAGSPNPGAGSLTWYYFGQGSYKDPSTGMYQTACGYFGTEPSGQDSDNVQNIANGGYFAAIPGANPMNFDTSRYCGACVEITNAGHTIIATVVDECPTNSNPICTDGHLDMSRPAFNALGFSGGSPTGVTWKFVPCPVQGNVKVRIKSGNPNEIYIENELVPIEAVAMNGNQANRQSYGAWHFGANIANGANLTLTDIAGRTINVTVGSTNANQNQDTGKQFPSCQ